MVDPLQLMKDAIQCTGKSKENRFVAGEIVWVLKVKRRNSKRVRLIETNDFCKTNQDFKLSDEEIRGRCLT